ncbi:MAG TPA: hypothetical protein VKS21_04240 [Spirochaetota bacterium]|nr:hypothetical protein [Spirochaetota bacterium]
MQKIILPLFLLLLFLPESGRADKFTAHLITLPLIEGSGAVAALTTLKHAGSPVSKSAAIANMGLLAVNSGLGLFTMIKKDKYRTIRRWHRIIGFSLTAAGIWLSLATSLDKGTAGKYIPYTAYGYTAMTLIPLLMFKF